MADLVESEGFQTAAFAAAAGAVAVALLALLLGGGPRRNPWVGLAFVFGAMFGLSDRSMLPDGIWPAVGALAVGGLVGDLVVLRAKAGSWASLAVRSVAVLPGALLLAGEPPEDPAWLTPALLAAVTVGSALAADFDRWASKLGGLPPLMWAATVFGMWATVPETQHAVVLAGAAVPIVVLGWPKPLAAFGGLGMAPAVGLLAWTAAVDGVGRAGSIVGAFGCLGLFVLEPLLRRVTGRRIHNVVVLGTAHLVLVGLSSRVAGLSDEALTALVFVALAYGSVATALVAIRFSER